MSLQIEPAPNSLPAADPVSVALGIDAAYAPHAAAVLASVARHVARPGLRVLVLHVGVPLEARARIEAAAPGAQVVWREIGEDDVPPMADREHFSRAILFRLGIEAHAPPEWRRLLYLDGDVIVADNLDELWRTDLSGAAVGAVTDCFVDAEAFAGRWGLDRAEARYFNSGVLLIDLEAVRREGLFTKAIGFAAANAAHLRFTDQDALNYALWGKWRRLETRWNVQRHMVIPALIAETPEERRLGTQRPAIVHYTGPDKPWLKRAYHPWSWLYWDNLARTPFLQEVARAEGMGPLRRLQLWQRWIRRRARAAR